MSLVSLSGMHVPQPSRPRRESPAQSQSRSLRHAKWLHAHEVGEYDPRTGKVRPWSVRDIATLYRTSVRTVQLGIAAAKRLRAQVARLGDGD